VSSKPSTIFNTVRRPIIGKLATPSPQFAALRGLRCDNDAMSATVRLFAVFRERLGQSSLAFDAAPDETVGSVWRRVVAMRPDIEGLRRVTRFAVNGEYATAETPVGDGDEVAFLPPMSGGLF
jgi:molybdopterin synthase sulfur carrier subunit